MELVYNVVILIVIGVVDFYNIMCVGLSFELGLVGDADLTLEDLREFALDELLADGRNAVDENLAV